MADRLLVIANHEGYGTAMDMLEAVITDSVVPAICTDCGFICDSEPDAADNWCEGCGGYSVTSCLIIAGII